MFLGKGASGSFLSFFNRWLSPACLQVWQEGHGQWQAGPMLVVVVLAPLDTSFEPFAGDGEGLALLAGTGRVR